jgi:hypothetical protein
MITSAKYLRSEQLSDSTYRIIVSLTDDVKGVYEDGFIASGTTVAELRDDVSRQIAAKNARLAVKNVLAGIAVNTNIPVTAPADPVPAVPTPKQVWFDKVNRLARMNSLAIPAGSPLASAIDALQLDVVATYVSGYLD